MTSFSFSPSSSSFFETCGGGASWVILIRNDGNEIYHHLLSRESKKWRTNAQKVFCFVIFYIWCATSASIYQIEREREKLFGNQIDRCISVCTVTLKRTWGRLSTGVRFSLKEKKKKKSLLEFFVFKFFCILFFIVVLLFPFGHFGCWAAERAKRVDLSCTRWEMCVCDTKIFVDCFLAAVWWLLAPI